MKGSWRFQADMEEARWLQAGMEGVRWLQAGIKGAHLLQVAVYDAASGGQTRLQEPDGGLREPGASG